MARGGSYSGRGTGGRAGKPNSGAGGAGGHYDYTQGGSGVIIIRYPRSPGQPAPVTVYGGKTLYHRELTARNISLPTCTMGDNAVVGSGAASFNGSQSIKVFAPGINLGALQQGPGFTIALWAKHRDGSWGRWFSMTPLDPADPSKYPYVSVGRQGSVSSGLFRSLDYLSGSQTVTDYTFPMELGEWVHFVFSTDASGDWKLYVDGVLLPTGVKTRVFPDTSDWLLALGTQVLADGGQDGTFIGEIDDFRLYSSALSRDAVAFLYHQHGIVPGMHEVGLAPVTRPHWRAVSHGVYVDRLPGVKVETMDLMGSTVIAFMDETKDYKVLITEDLQVDLLMIGGGGGGSARMGAGGGAGEVVFAEAVNISKGEYNVSVGAGGWGQKSEGRGDDGFPTVAFGALARHGGGGGGSWDAVGRGHEGGSGGGSPGCDNQPAEYNGLPWRGDDGPVLPYANFLQRLGNRGGQGTSRTSGYNPASGGGGGGAGGAGQNGAYRCGLSSNCFVGIDSMHVPLTM